MAVKFQFRYDTSNNWTTVDPVLSMAEIGIETDTDRFKIGNGVDHWTTRPYGGIQGPRGAQGVQGIQGYSNLTILKQATEAVLRTELVSMASPDNVKLAHNNTTLNDSIVLGMALNDAVTGEMVEVLITGIINDALFSVFSLNSIIFLDTSGGTSDTRPVKPTAKYSTLIGKSLGNGDVYINAQNPVIL